MKRKFGLQEWCVVVFALVFVIVVASTTTYFTIVKLQGKKPDAASSAYRLATFTDAVILCKERVSRQFGERIKVAAINDHSSRFDKSTNSYLIFMNVQLTALGTPRITEHWNTCRVSAVQGDITEFETSSAEIEVKQTPIRNGGKRLFEWPR